MSKKLTYFGGHGRARPCRMLLDHAKVKYEDCRIGFEEYGAMKAAGKVNGLPVYEEQGV